MKKLILLSSLFMALFFSNKIQAQDDPNIGIYVDNVKVSELTCFSFKTLDAVFENKDEFKNYDAFSLSVELKSSQGKDENGRNKILGYIKIYLTKNMAENRHGKYLIFRTYSPNKQEPNGEIIYNVPYPTRGLMAYYTKDEDAEAYFQVYFLGGTVAGYTERIAQNGTIYKEPLYSWETIQGPNQIVLKNREKKKGAFLGVEEKKVDLKQICEIKGTIVNYDDFKKIESFAKTEPVISKTNSGTHNSSSNSNSSSAANASTLKPLDKSKPGYFANKNGGQITLEGYKNKNGQINGEVRRYEEGKLREVSTYVNDEKNGPASLYNENGNIEASGNYKNGAKDGEWKRYNENGKFAGTDVYVDGEKQ